jgi:hypothetical protein
MSKMNRKQFLLGASAAGMALSIPPLSAETPDPLRRVNPNWVVSETEAMAWHKVKDSNGPALAGNASWHHFLEFLEAKLKEYRCINVHRSSWMFDRMETSYWPDDSKWSLVSNGARLTVANYGANCGLTGPEGVTTELVLWDPLNKPDVAGKIIVFRPVPRADVRDAFSGADYEYMTAFESWPVEGRAVPQELTAIPSIASVVWDEMTASAAIIHEVAPAKPAGLIFAMNLNRAATEGLYTFPVPEQYGFPSVYLDNTNGDRVIADAKAHAMATIRVEGRHVQSQAYELIAYLPGRNYGTDKDEQIQLRTHTDGPSISQDDGAFGLLGVVKYMSNIPQKDRPRSLLIELDCRHFMPGAERTWQAQDYFVKFPNARDKVVGLIAMEHMGQIDYVFDGDDLAPSGRSMQTWIYSPTDQKMIDYAYQAAQENRIPSAIVRAPGQPGVHGKSQGPWYGMGGVSRFLGLPAFSMQGDLGAYWAFSGRINRFDSRSFSREVSLFCQLTGYLMRVDVKTLQVPKDERAMPSVIRPH